MSDIPGQLRRIARNLAQNGAVTTANDLRQLANELEIEAAPSSEVIRVKIAVAVDAHGQIGSKGVQGDFLDEKTAMDMSLGRVDLTELIGKCFAIVDIPRIPTITARTEAKGGGGAS